MGFLLLGGIFVGLTACGDGGVSSVDGTSTIDFANQEKISHLDQAQFEQIIKSFAKDIPVEARTGKCEVIVAGADFNNDKHGDFAITSYCLPANKSVNKRASIAWDLYLAHVNSGSIDAVEYKKLNTIYFNAAQILVKPYEENIGLIVMYLRENAWEGNIVELKLSDAGMRRLSKTKAEKNEQGKALLEKTFNDKTFFPIFNAYRLSEIASL